MENCTFSNNYANYDGGAVSTFHSTSDIYNCNFNNNSAYRDGGALKNNRDSTQTYTIPHL